MCGGQASGEQLTSTGMHEVVYLDDQVVVAQGQHDGLVRKQENSRGVIHCATQPVDRSLDIVLLFRAAGITVHWTMGGYGDTVRASANLEVI